MVENDKLMANFAITAIIIRTIIDAETSKQVNNKMLNN